MPPGGSRWFDVLQFAGLVLTALILVPAGAHLFEMPNKMRLSPEEYMTVQRIYANWALFGAPIYTALLLMLVHGAAVRANPRALLWSLAAALCIAATQVLFWTYTYPVNALTGNWTRMPPDLDAARRQWEYSHAANAVLTLAALAAFALSVLASRPCPAAASGSP